MNPGVKISRNMVVHTYNPRTWEPEEGKLLRGWLNFNMVSSKPVLAMSKTLTQTETSPKTNKQT